MSLIYIILVLIAVGFLLWVINTYIPMAAPIKALLNLLVLIILILWLLQSFGIITSIPRLGFG